MKLDEKNIFRSNVFICLWFSQTTSRYTPHDNSKKWQKCPKMSEFKCSRSSLFSFSSHSNLFHWCRVAQRQNVSHITVCLLHSRKTGADNTMQHSIASANWRIKSGLHFHKIRVWILGQNQRLDFSRGQGQGRHHLTSRGHEAKATSLRTRSFLCDTWNSNEQTLQRTA